MMIRTPFFLLFLAGTLIASSTTAQTTTAVDPERSTIKWHGSKVTGAHDGELRVKHGTMTMRDDVPVAAEVVVDMTSITCTDITNESSNQRLVAHLNSEDFFHTEVHPQATFSATRFEALPASESNDLNYRVTGDLTIKGITRPTEFDLAITPVDDGHRIMGTLTFDRAEYDIKYRSGSFFEALGDKMIHDEVRLDLDLRTQ